MSNLARIPLLKDIPARSLRAAEAQAVWFSVPGGGTLFDEGTSSDSIYFVLSGTLGAFRRAADGRVEFLGHIRPGEPVGEMAMLAGEPHSNSVLAVRDTEVIKLPRQTFMKMVRSSPEVMERLSRILLLRLRQTRRSNNQRGEPKVFALTAASPTIDLKLRARVLAEALARLGLSAAIVGEEAEHQGASYFDALEASNDIVILTSTMGNSAWFKLSLRQADRIWVLARPDARPSTPLLPDENSPAKNFRLIDVVLIEHSNGRRVSEPPEWLDAAGAARCFHWGGVQGNDCNRLARVMAGRSVGVVFSGGGARAYSHIGVVRALREFNCPIDFVGGASMGAVIGACVAKGWDDDEIEFRIRKAFVESNPLGDYTLPVVSMVKGKRVDDRLKEHFGDTNIPDLHLPYFAVSTNLTTGAIHLHTRGRLRDALRATIALPGILPPFVENGEVLVDGAVLNNFPVNIMRQTHRGFIIGCDVARTPEGLAADDFIDPPGFAGWVLQHGMSEAPPIASLLMRTATLSVDPNAGRELTDILVVPELPNLDLRDWEEYDRAVEAGYESTREALSRAGGPIARLMKRPAL
ncbi:patatin-like phospholipase family protein [Ponticaulis sp.]|uniref:patatin-like phospholipase family protein n=1 Tax=Ponticaulis sp. TaxID=2020902 RepID=UPI000B63DC1B|nr:patatin-like phospholipase family protein [Ponticaulis sp.]MAI89727.1 cyclic nucleotide-binding protein [Ponticaulis sp.]OUY00743.1 MAG: cyclic nucleotide-binding protein [Hyphomonadaceae bacterium TMED5]